jgi:hypothetical protein
MVTPATTDAQPPNESVCEQAGRLAERTHALPAGLLLAIGRVESGRWDATRGRVVTWPWAVDAAGDGALLDTSQAAIARTAALRDTGHNNVDVGCFQINLGMHPLAFTDLQQAFDPVANADFAARFLTELHVRLGNWNDAVAAYHSAQPELGTPYRQAVFANWALANSTMANATLANSTLTAHAAPPETTSDTPSGPVVVQLASGATIRIWTPSGPGAAAGALAFTPLAAALLPHVLIGTPSPR